MPELKVETQAMPILPVIEFSESERQAFIRGERIRNKEDKLLDADWSKLALLLTGESPEIETLAKKRLKNFPELNNILRKELAGPFASLALDVIATFEKKEFFDELLALSSKDEDGFVAQTLNLLIDEKNFPILVDTYTKYLSDEKLRSSLSPPARIAYIDTLHRLEVPLKNSTYVSLFDDPSFELRIMTMRHLKNSILKSKDSDLLDAYKKAFRAEPVELRLLAIDSLNDIPSHLRSEARSFLNQCVRDTSMIVRAECQSAVDKVASDKEKAI